MPHLLERIPVREGAELRRREEGVQLLEAWRRDFAALRGSTEAEGCPVLRDPASP